MASARVPTASRAAQPLTPPCFIIRLNKAQSVLSVCYITDRQTDFCQPVMDLYQQVQHKKYHCTIVYST